MNYLQVVNNVLRRMRENEVSTVTESVYSTMVGDYVNDAYTLISDAWDWSAFRTTLTIETVADIFNYVLVDSQNRIKMLSFLNDSSNWFMKYKPQVWMDNVFLNNDPLKGAPQYFTYNGVDLNGDTQIDIYPIPDGVYTLRYNCILRPENLTSDTDKILIPSQPLIHMSIALLSRERGETGGASAAELYNIADRYLGDAIALDAHKHPEELIWNYI
jgi:hypothetical protein